MSVILTLGGDSVTLPNPNYPGRLRPQRFQQRNAAMGGRIETLNMVGTTRLRQPRLSYVDPGLLIAKYDELATFIQDIADGTSNAFTLTDWDSNNWTVKYWGGFDEFDLVRRGYMGGTFECREVPT